MLAHRHLHNEFPIYPLDSLDVIDHRCSSLPRLFSILVLFPLVTALTSSLHTVRAQPTGDVFSSDSGRDKTWWDVKRRDYPDCAGLVDQHEAMTKRLYQLDAEAKRAVEPRRKQLVQQINDLSRQRTRVQRLIFNRIRDSSKPPSDDGQKGLKSIPEKPPQQDVQPAPVTFDKAVDDCFSKSVPNYRSPIGVVLLPSRCVQNESVNSSSHFSCPPSQPTRHCNWTNSCTASGMTGNSCRII